MGYIRVIRRFVNPPTHRVVNPLSRPTEPPTEQLSLFSGRFPFKGSTKHCPVRQSSNGRGIYSIGDN